MSNIQATELREKLMKQFSETELDALCSDVAMRVLADGKQLGNEVTLKVVGGRNKLAMVNNLIQYMDRRGWSFYLDAAITAKEVTPLARQIVADCQYRNLIPQLLQACKEIHPNVAWPKMPQEDVRQQSLAEWSLLIYIAAHNSLQESGTRIIEQLFEIGSSEQIKLAAVFGQANGATWYQIHGSKTSEVGALHENFDSGSPQSLVDVARWAFSKNPARRHGIILWGHCVGWSAMLHDDGTQHSLSAVELGRALQQINNSIGQPIDLLGMDMGLSGCIELAYQIREQVRYLVASEELGPATSWPYDPILNQLKSTPDLDAKQLAQLIVSQYLSYYEKNCLKLNTGDITKVILDLSRMDEACKGIDKLVMALLDDMQNSRHLIWDAQRISLNKETLEGKRIFNKFQYQQWDVGSFAQQLAQTSKDGQVQTAAQSLLTLLKPDNSFIFQEAHLGNWFDGISGVSIYLPPANISPIFVADYDNLAFAKDTLWLKLIQAYRLAYADSSQANESKSESQRMTSAETNPSKTLDDLSLSARLQEAITRMSIHTLEGLLDLIESGNGGLQLPSWFDKKLEKELADKLKAGGWLEEPTRRSTKSSKSKIRAATRKK